MPAACTPPADPRPAAAPPPPRLAVVRASPHHDPTARQRADPRAASMPPTRRRGARNTTRARTRPPPTQPQPPAQPRNCGSRYRCRAPQAPAPRHHSALMGTPDRTLILACVEHSECLQHRLNERRDSTLERSNASEEAHELKQATLEHILPHENTHLHTHTNTHTHARDRGPARHAHAVARPRPPQGAGRPTRPREAVARRITREHTLDAVHEPRRGQNVAKHFQNRGCGGGLDRGSRWWGCAQHHMAVLVRFRHHIQLDATHSPRAVFHHRVALQVEHKLALAGPLAAHEERRLRRREGHDKEHVTQTGERP